VQINNAYAWQLLLKRLAQKKAQREGWAKEKALWTNADN
jgi:hypothetical protein